MKSIQTVGLSESAPGDKTAEAIADNQGRVLVPAGTLLTDSLITSLARRGIEQVKIEREVEEAPEIVQARQKAKLHLLEQRFSAAGNNVATLMMFQAIKQFIEEAV